MITQSRLGRTQTLLLDDCAALNLSLTMIALSPLRGTRTWPLTLVTIAPATILRSSVAPVHQKLSLFSDESIVKTLEFASMWKASQKVSI